MRFIRGLVSEQIAVSTGVKEFPVTILLELAYRQRDSAVRVSFLDSAHDRDYRLVSVVRVLAALQHKSAESQFVTGVTARQDLLLTQAVAFGVGIVSSDSTVTAIVFAYICKFDQSAHINVLAVVLLTNRPGPLCQILAKARQIAKQHTRKLIISQVLSLRESVSKFKLICSFRFFCIHHDSPPF